MSNPNQIPWEHYQDIQVSDVSLRDQFNRYMNLGMYTEAISILKLNKDQLLGKSYVAETINIILSSLLSLQGFFNNGVNLYLSDLAKTYTIMINNFYKKGPWNPLMEYVPYNFIVYQDDIYMAIQNVPANQPPTNTTYWLKLGLRGQDGAPGIDLTMKYAWGPSRQYVPRDLVVYGGNIYVALQANTNIVPGTDESIWLTFLLISKGKIHVGVSPSGIDLVDNAIWLKTKEDPNKASEPIEGQFYRYIKNEWEPMYPGVLFTWIEGTEFYAPKADVKVLIVPPEEWTAVGDTAQFYYPNKNITEKSMIIINPAIEFNKDQRRLYNSLVLNIQNGSFTFATNIQPVVALKLNVVIQ